MCGLRYEALTRQYDDSVHRLNMARQAKERAMLDAQRKDEEACALQVCMGLQGRGAAMVLARLWLRGGPVVLSTWLDGSLPHRPASRCTWSQQQLRAALGCAALAAMHCCDSVARCS